ncbi:hypothetical protein RHO12_02955 [Orbus sturtevantii]|uniref:hypothetical protein n=1 Tax=Orbus sturtevantii TaxID=3074109 RepID=UPI00370D0E17
MVVTPDGAENLKNIAMDVGGGGGLICASRVSEVLEKSGMFPGFDSTSFPGNLKFPSINGPETQIINPPKKKK